ncbi:MAG: recombination-associated protein RdgC [Burkholderiales bacterium 21-58-4]|nr:MAG: recombination-associated protein RdgC [Burkholderiales bacterium 21-58-4]
MWFRNLQVYRIGGWQLAPAELDEKLSKRPLQQCAGSELQSAGWVPPNEEAYVHSLGGQMLIALGVEKKLLPASVISQHARARAEEIEEREGFRPGKKRMKEIREAVTDELLPRAFVLRRRTLAWINPEGKWLAIDASNPARAEELLDALRKSSVEFSASLVRTAVSPKSAMTGWLSGNDLPSSFTVDRDCELRSREDEKSKVRYAHHSLDSEEIRRHIGQGKEATKLAMTWSDKISFVLHEDFQLRRVTPLFEEEAEEDAFEAEFAIMTGELSRLLPDLVDALGGEQEV